MPRRASGIVASSALIWFSFAAQPDDQHAAGIGMTGEACHDGPRAFQVLTELRAAVRMREGVDAVDRITDQCCGLRGDTLRGARDATDGRQDPDLVTRADNAVGADIAFECRSRCDRRRCRVDRIEPIGERAFEPGLEIVRVDARAGGYRLRRGADRKAVLDHRIAHCDRSERNFVATPDVGGQDQASGVDALADRHDLARQGIVKQCRDAVARIDPQSSRHRILFYR
jgi:hypothetical protein